MTRIRIIFILTAFVLKGAAQKFVEPDKMKAFNITVNYPTYTAKTQMLKDPKKIKTDPELTYCWYASQKIIETKGGFDGKLLHGYYHSFYLNSQLMESGDYKYGLKNGEWKNWYPDGKLKEITTWKNGIKSGKFALYNDFGLKMASGKFKHNLLHGKFYTYDNQGNVSLTQTYKNGKELVKKEKKASKRSAKDKNIKETQPETEQPAETEKPVKEKKKLFSKKKPVAEPENESKKERPAKKEKKASTRPAKEGKKDASTHPADGKHKDAKSKEVKPKEKRSFGDRIRSIFKKKPKETKPKSNTTKTSQV